MKIRGLFLVALLCLAGAAACDEAQEEAPVEQCRRNEQAIPINVGNPPNAQPIAVPDADSLRAALEGPCVSRRCWLKLTGALYQGPFVIPPGSFIEGVVVDNTSPIIKNSTAVRGEAVVQIPTHGGCEVTVLRNLEIENEQGSGISAPGGGVLLLEGVQVEIHQGVALAAADLQGLWLKGVVLRSDWDLAALRELPEALSPEEHPLVGLLADRVGRVLLEDAQLVGFAGYGAALRDSVVDWRGSRAAQNLGYGIFVTGPEALIRFEDGEVEETLRSNQWREYVSIGLVLREQARAEGSGLMLLNNEGVGAVQDGSSADLSGLVASGNALPGWWVQRGVGRDGGPALRLQGSTLVENTLAGLVVLNSDGLALEEVEIGATLPSNRFEGLELEQVADGAQLVGLTGAVTMRGVTLRDNRRAGLLLDGTGALSPATFTFAEVQITAAEVAQDTYGVVQQELLAPISLEGVEVEPALSTNDEALEARLPVTGASAAPESQRDARWLGEGGLLTPEGAPAEGAEGGAGGL